jgi:phage baseplate assembly protein W
VALIIVPYSTTPFVALAPLSLANVPHLAFPFGLTRDGSVGTVPQDTLEEITQCVQVLLGTALGSREDLLEYGISDPTFAVLDTDAISAAIAEWEPRAVVKLTRPAPPDTTVLIEVGRTTA